MNLVELAEQHFLKFGEKTSIIFNNRAYSNIELLTSANKLANGLIKRGIKPKDKIIVLLMNSPEVIISYQAIWRTGAVVVPVIFLLGAKDISHIMKNSEATVVITSKEFLETVNEARKNVRSIKHVFVIEEESSSAVPIRTLLADSSPERPAINIKEDKMAVILYTSGTTGTPKGVVLTHKNLYQNALSISSLDPDRNPDDVSLLMLPLSHSYGLAMLNITQFFPNHTVLMPWFELERVCQLIEQHKITGFAAVPSMFTLLLNSSNVVDKYDLSSLKECICGSAPLAEEVLTAFEEKFGCKILEGYGLSEAAPTVSGYRRDQVRKPGSIGFPISDIEIKIVDENDEEVGVNEIGELIVFGPSVSSGYYKLPIETEMSFRKGWLYTGDMVKMDADGYLYMVDRKKDIIIRGGFNIIPREIEEILYRHPQIVEAAVVGVPDKILGEEIKAFVIKQQGADLSEEDIIEHCKDYLADYKCPKFVKFLDALPRNAIGKLLRKHLRNLNDNRE